MAGPAAAHVETHHRDEVAPVHLRRLRAGRGNALDGLPARFPAGEQKVLDVEADAHGQEP